MIQGSDEWKMARCGKLTASRVHDILPGKRGGYLRPREVLFYELLAERISGQPKEHFINAAMQWGMEKEPMARSVYEAVTGVTVTEVGFIEHPALRALGASPDGILPDGEGGVEIKCPTRETHIKLLAGGDMDPKYFTQIQVSMWVTGRVYWDFFNYDPRMPYEYSYVLRRVERSHRYIEMLDHECRKFLHELDYAEKKIRGDRDAMVEGDSEGDSRLLADNRNSNTDDKEEA
jgi:putative phage-type endonuclease